MFWKMFLAALILTTSGCFVESVECVYDNDCYSNEYCMNNYCVPYELLYPSGHTLTDCDCWNSHYPETSYNYTCSSGLEATFTCDIFCWPEGYWAWGRECV